MGVSQFVPASYGWLQGAEKVEWKGFALKPTYLVDIMHTFITKYYFFGSAERNLHSELLRKKYGTHYNRYFDYLRESGALEVTSSYAAGKKCKTWKMAESLLRGQVVRTVNSDRLLARKYKAGETEIATMSDRRPPEHMDEGVRGLLLSHMERASVDLQGALDWLEREDLTDDQRKKGVMSVWHIHERSLFCVFDRWGRAHTNFTTLRRALRNSFVRIDGEPVVELDVKNSQPLFLSRMLLADPAVDRGCVERFCRLASRGELYDHMLERWRLVKPGATRRDVKELTYKVLFGRNKKGNLQNRFFRLLFPEVWSWMRAYKKKNGGHGSLARALQLAESEFVFGKVVKELDPSVPVLTVHDSVICSVRDLREVSLVFDAAVSELRLSCSPATEPAQLERVLGAVESPPHVVREVGYAAQLVAAEVKKVADPVRPALKARESAVGNCE